MHTQQIEGAYEADGVVRVRGLLDPDKLEDVRRQIDRYMREIAPTLPAKEVVFEADGKTVRNLWRMERYEPYFAALANDPELLRMVEGLVGGTRCSWASRRSTSRRAWDRRCRRTRTTPTSAGSRPTC